jgi:hypothetical protein
MQDECPRGRFAAIIETEPGGETGEARPQLDVGKQAAGGRKRVEAVTEGGSFSVGMTRAIEAVGDAEEGARDVALGVEREGEAASCRVGHRRKPGGVDDRERF